MEEEQTENQPIATEEEQSTEDWMAEAMSQLSEMGIDFSTLF